LPCSLWSRHLETHSANPALAVSTSWGELTDQAAGQFHPGQCVKSQGLVSLSRTPTGGRGRARPTPWSSESQCLCRQSPP
jgi:hypothetical protein